MSNLPGSVKPSFLKDIIGQADVRTAMMYIVENISTEINNKMDRNESKKHISMNGPITSILLYGMPGHGKTTFAEAFSNDLMKKANENKWPMFKPSVDTWIDINPPNYKYYYYARVEGQDIQTYDILDSYLSFIQPYGTLFIDEVHLMPKNVQEKLYFLLENKMWDSNYTGERTIHWPMNLILATTDPQELKDPLKDRIQYKLTISPYTKSDLIKMVHMTMKKSNMDLSDDIVELIVDRSNISPRRVVDTTLKVITHYRNRMDQLSVEDVIKFFVTYQIYAKGLTSQALRVLDILNNEEKPISIDRLMIKSRINRNEYKTEIEPILFNDTNSFVDISTRGVNITEKGVDVLSEARAEHG